MYEGQIVTKLRDIFIPSPSLLMCLSQLQPSSVGWQFHCFSEMQLRWKVMVTERGLR